MKLNCKKCNAVYAYRDRSRSYCFECSPFQKRKPKATDTHKFCSSCEQMLGLDMFSKDVSSPSGLTYNCKDCLTKYKRIPSVRKRNTKNERLRRTSTETNRLADSYRGRIRVALRKKNHRKSCQTTILLGMSFYDLKLYLESLWEEGMSWENYGNPNGDQTDCWHVDHIKPCALFDLSNEDEQKLCFHYTNLQPLWAKDNLSKGCKYNE